MKNELPQEATHSYIKIIRSARFRAQIRYGHLEGTVRGTFTTTGIYDTVSCLHNNTYKGKATISP
jgi:hypothetical protein